MDTIDKKIFQLLSDNIRLNNIDLVTLLNLAPATTPRKVKNFEENGVIENVVHLYIKTSYT